ncbi:MAG: four helix bundle protein [Candidatus Yonathbacteria bacterium]|nr:four helix bundle protein [Candidatus Yonathbacteria bacterium]
MATGLENLNIYKLAAELEVKVFHLTKKFPNDEKYRSVDQLRRSSASVTNNIAESYHKRSLKEKTRILNDIVKGEAEETRKNLEMCFKKGFHDDHEISQEYLSLLKMVSGYIRFLKGASKNKETKELINQ